MRRGEQDNQKLFAYTFDVLKWGECVAIFPEGGSCVFLPPPSLASSPPFYPPKGRLELH